MIYIILHHMHPCISVIRSRTECAFPSNGEDSFQPRRKSRRNFFAYDHTTVPTAPYFEDSLRNSFPDEKELVQFVNKFYISFMSNAQEFKVTSAGYYL